MERAMAVVLAREVTAVVGPGSPLSGATVSARKARGPPPSSTSTSASAAHQAPPLTLPGWQFASASSGIPASVYAAVMSKGALSYRCPHPSPQPYPQPPSHSHSHSDAHSHLHSHTQTRSHSHPYSYPHSHSQSHSHSHSLSYSHSHPVKKVAGVASALPSRKASSELVGGCHSYHHHHQHAHPRQYPYPASATATTITTPVSACASAAVAVLPPRSLGQQAYPLPSPTRVVAAAAAAASAAVGGAGGGPGVFLYPSGPPLPYCSASCRSCPTSSRMLLQLHSLKLGLGPAGGGAGGAAHDSSSWGGAPGSCYCEQQQQQSMSTSMERSSRGVWRRRSWKSRRRTRASAAVSSEQIARKSSASEPMTPPFNVLITGSSKGLGYALAKEFLKHGDNVIICSRSEERVEVALKELRKEFPEQKILGTTCDVRSGKSVQGLVDFAKSQLGFVDIWINNAGTNAYSFKTLVDTNDTALAEIVTTNALGVMLCCRQAIRTMVEQPRGGHIFNMDGAGADGNPTPRFAAYGATKRSLAQFTKSLQAELKQQAIKHVVVHNLSPGMVTTDLLMAGSDTRQAKFFINVLAEPAEVVARYLVPRIRAIPSDKNKSSKYIRFLTGFKAYSQIISRLIFKARKDRFVTED